MKANAMVALILMIILIAYRWAQTPPSIPSPIEPISQQSPQTIQIAPARFTLVTVTQPQQQNIGPLSRVSAPPEENPYAKPPQGSIIEFKIVNGWAVAHGDLLLGKPPEDFKETRGRYEAPQPKIWENGEIPYLIDQNLPQPQRVEKAIQYFQANTPIKFVPYQNQKDAIIFQPGEKDCYSYIGKVGGVQPIHLSQNCQPQQIMHEIMHALGFIHEQSRPDRDQFLEIVWDKIQPDYFPQYAMMPEPFFEIERNTPFDYHSVMLYPTQAFAKDPSQPTMRSLGNDTISPSQDGLSDEDIRKIRQLYRR